MPKTIKTVACILVRDAKVFAWLGHKPIINWAIERLHEVRGIDHLVCVADPKLATQTARLLAKMDIDTVVLPPALTRQKTERDIDNWLASAAGPADDADVILSFRPTSPFMPAAKIEAALDAVARNAADTCVTVREVSAYVRLSAVNPAAPVSRLSAYSEVGTVRAFAPARVVERPIGRFQPIQVSLIESLDVSIPDNLRVASALVAAGNI
jgi:CMP-N-acetylneuraminic acid synthetase